MLNIVNGFGAEAGKPLGQNKRIAKIAFTGETATGRMIMHYASDNIIPVTLELGGKSPNIFFADVIDADDDYFDKALEGFALFALNQGEVCTCPSRALVQESIYDNFMERAVARPRRSSRAIRSMTTMIGAQASNDQIEKILSYFDIGKQEGAQCLTGGKRAHLGGELAEGYYIEPTIFDGNNKMRVFQEEIFGPVVSVTTFKDEDEALAHRQRHALWARRRRLDPQRQPRLSLRPGHSGRPRLDQLLPRLSGARRLRRLQGVRHRPREPQDDARPLSADQEHPGQLRHQGSRLLLRPSESNIETVIASAASNPSA